MNPQKEYNRENARKILNAKSINFESLNNDLHWKIGTMDFYPTTLRWNDSFKNINGIGIKEMIKELYIGEQSIGDKQQLSIEQMFTIAKRVNPLNLEKVCQKLHEAIYKGEKT